MLEQMRKRMCSGHSPSPLGFSHSSCWARGGQGPRGCQPPVCWADEQAPLRRRAQPPSHGKQCAASFQGTLAGVFNACSEAHHGQLERRVVEKLVRFLGAPAPSGSSMSSMDGEGHGRLANDKRGTAACSSWAGMPASCFATLPRVTRRPRSGTACRRLAACRRPAPQRSAHHAGERLHSSTPPGPLRIVRISCATACR